MSELKAGDSFPEGVSFAYVKPTAETSDVLACGMPTKFDASAGMPSSLPSAARNPQLPNYLPLTIAKLHRVQG